MFDLPTVSPGQLFIQNIKPALPWAVEGRKKKIERYGSHIFLLF